jgi:hypothetical protein
MENLKERCYFGWLKHILVGNNKFNLEEIPCEYMD